MDYCILLLYKVIVTYYNIAKILSVVYQYFQVISSSFKNRF